MVIDAGAHVCMHKDTARRKHWVVIDAHTVIDGKLLEFQQVIDARSVFDNYTRTRW